MTAKEIDKIIDYSQCYLKETFLIRKNNYEIVNSDDVTKCKLTYLQSESIKKRYKLSLTKTDYSGFTRLWYKIEKL